MGDETTTSDTTDATAATDAAGTTSKSAADTATDTTDWKAEAEKAKADAEKWKGLSRKHEGQSKANAAAATTARTLEERLADLEKREAEAQGRATRAEIATEKGLSAPLAKRLVGSTREELEADADELLKELAAKGGGKPADADVRRRPTERLRSGSVPDAEPPEDNDPRKLAALVPRS